ncbi:MAG: flagellar basal-body MS-ring/collar protein FliF, partial [Hyphomicrobium sp.]
HVMPSWIQFDRLWDNLMALGPRRLTALGGIGLAVIALIAFGSHYLSRPDFEVLYSGLSQQDASRMGAALSEAGIDFDVSSDGTKVSVRPQSIAQARMLLAEKGLPASATAGYELFDKLGPMGLTSFMQEVTRARVLEGELARSIQTLRGVRAARVHIVMANGESFRREKQKPSASVVVKMDGIGELNSAQAIRHLVAAAVPGMTADLVEVVSTDGKVLASQGDLVSQLPNKMIEVEKAISKELQDKIRRTLTPYLGADNFEISIAAKINMDKRQTSETAFDPKSRVERSVRVIRQADNSQNTNNASAVGAEQNVPGEEAGQSQGETSKKSNDRREELTNFEINSKSTATESQGYRIDQLTVAVLLNRKRLVETAGGTVVNGALEPRLKEVENLVRSSAGLDTARGDQITVAAVDFIQAPGAVEPESSRGIMEILLSQLGSVIRSLTIVGVAAVLVIFGLRPAVRMLLETPTPQGALNGGALSSENLALGASADGSGSMGLPPPNGGEEDDEAIDALANSTKATPQRRLEKIVNINEEQAATILRQWLQTARAG